MKIAIEDNKKVKYIKLYKVKAKLYRNEKRKNHYYAKLSMNNRIIKVTSAEYYKYHGKLEGDKVDLELPIEIALECEKEYWINQKEILDQKIRQLEKDKNYRNYSWKLNTDGLGCDLLRIDEVELPI